LRKFIDERRGNLAAYRNTDYIPHHQLINEDNINMPPAAAPVRRRPYLKAI